MLKSQASDRRDRIRPGRGMVPSWIDFCRKGLNLSSSCIGSSFRTVNLDATHILKFQSNHVFRTPWDTTKPVVLRAKAVVSSYSLWPPWGRFSRITYLALYSRAVSTSPCPKSPCPLRPCPSLLPSPQVLIRLQRRSHFASFKWCFPL
jgi:hypothetical protein